MLRRNIFRRGSSNSFQSESLLYTIQAIFYRPKNASCDQTQWHLPADAPFPLERRQAIEQKRLEYTTFQGFDYASPYVEQIPISEYLLKNRMRHYFNQFMVLGAMIMMNLRGYTGNAYSWIMNDPNVYHRFYNIFQMSKIDNFAPMPMIAKREWKADYEFALRRMIGMNPTVLKRVTKEYFDSLNDKSNTKKYLPHAALKKAVEPTLAPYGKTLDELITKGKLFVCDYEELDEIKWVCPVDRNLMTPLAFFWVQPGRGLMPLAIQLAQVHDERHFPIFTPNDPAGAWRLAKLHVQVADCTVLEVSRHLQATHLVAESTYVTMNRNMSVQHPISAWLTQHFFYTININWNARTKLIGPDGAVPRIFPTALPGTQAALIQAARDFNLEKYNVPKMVVERGINDPKVLSEHYWRDDALRLWPIIESFVKNMVELYYKSDEALANDPEIQAWMQELTAPLAKTGTAGTGHNLKGIRLTNGVMAKRADFIQFITTILWLITGEHGAVNNGAYEVYSFVPYNPFQLKFGPNGAKIDLGDREIADGMLSTKDTIAAASFVRLLTLPSPDLIGKYEGPFFDQEAVKKNVDKFNEELRALSLAIDKRNSSSANPYNFLNPSQLGNGIFE